MGGSLMNNKIIKKSIILGIILLVLGSFITTGVDKELKLNLKLDFIDNGNKKLPQTFFSNPPKEEFNKTFGGLIDDTANVDEEIKTVNGTQLFIFTKLKK